MSELATSLPAVKFKKHVKATDGIARWVDIDISELAEGKKIVIFGLPGAFTPTCSSQQLPGFEENYFLFRDAGIDDIYCVTVNDTFVCSKWAMDQELANVKVLPDGSGEFTIKMGMDVRKDNLGFGMRSWRYAAVYDDGMLVWSGVEEGFGDNFEGDPYEVSKPENVLDNVKAFGWPSVTETLGEEGREIELNFSETTDVKETFS